MKKFIFSVLFIFLINIVFPQSTGNIPLHSKSKFNRYYGAGDVWGVQINNINYALVTLDGGLSIVNTNNPSSPVEVAHINRVGYNPQDYTTNRIWTPDVETYIYGGTTYAYLATNIKSDLPPNPSYPLVMIINLNAAINIGGTILVDPYNPSGTVYVGKINDIGQIDRSHTLTIAGNYLYVATTNDSLPVWKLSDTPTSPLWKGFVTLNPSNCQIHEMFVKPIGGNQARVYVAALTGGLQVLELAYSEGPPPKGGLPQITVNSRVEHLYDFDRAYPNERWSPYPFDYRFTHSAWPTDDEQYVFTTDELSIRSDVASQYHNDDPNLYSSGVLKTPRREGAFLRTWKRSLLTQNSSFKGGYYVSEEHPWGITNLTQLDTNWVPNSIHQMYVKGTKMYLAHYSQGFRYLDISDPENIIELGYYDDYPAINFSPASSYFFRKRIPGIQNGIFNWAAGVYGVFPDPNRSTICYGGGTEGLYIFDLLAIPYPPTNLVVTPNSNGHYVLSWTPSQTLNPVYYRIYRASVPIGEPYQLPLYTTINAFEGGTLVTSWEDINSITGSGNGTYLYEISIVNPLGRESVHSNRVAVGQGQPWKINPDEDAEEQREQIEYALSSNYPNPFNPSTTIDYSIKLPGAVTLKVFDMLGTEVAILVNERKEQGNYSVRFNADNLPSGIYFYTLTSGNFMATKKLILLK